MPKQNRRKVRIGGFEFDSKHEANRYMFLLGQAQAHIITDFQPRPLAIEIACHVALPKNALRPKKVIRQARVYTPDFSYIYHGVQVFEDVKAAYNKTGKSGRNRKGTAIVSESSRLRMRLLQGQRPDCVVVMVMVITWWWGEKGGHRLL